MQRNEKRNKLQATIPPPTAISTDHRRPCVASGVNCSNCAHSTKCGGNQQCPRACASTASVLTFAAAATMRGKDVPKMASILHLGGALQRLLRAALVKALLHGNNLLDPVGEVALSTAATCYKDRWPKEWQSRK